jgi:hypothetical protein
VPDASVLVIKKAPVLLSSSCGLARCQPPSGSSVLLTSTHPRKWLDAPLYLVVLVDPAALRNGKENKKIAWPGFRRRRRRGPGRGSGLGLGEEGRGRDVEEVDGVEERARAAAVGPEASAELLDLVAALPGRLGRGGRGDGGPVSGGQVLPADGEAARGVGPREREGLVGRPARGRHAPAGGAGGGRRGHGGGGPGGDGEAVVEDGMDGAVGYNGGVPLRR